MTGQHDHDHECEPDHDCSKSTSFPSVSGPCCGHGVSPDAPAWQGFVEPAICLAGLIAGLLLHAWSGDVVANGSASATAVSTLPWLVLLAYLVSFIAGGGHTLWEALSDLRRGRVNIDLLMILAACGAALLGNWPEGAVLLFLFSLSHALEQFILGRTRGAIASLMKLTPDDAVVIREGAERTIRVEELVIGDRVAVRPSERIPADGVIRDGHTTVDQSPMTGESIPVEKYVGDAVLAGTLNQHCSIQIEVTRVGGETTLARMVRLVEEAQSEKADSEQFTDWFGQRYSVIVLAGTVALFLVGRYGCGDSFSIAFQRAMTALVVASPCAVVISIPAAILSAIASAARGGVLFKGGSHLERTAALRAMAFDKTGTLTIGRPALTSLLTAPGISETELLMAAAALESQSKHPLARTVVEAARTRGLTVPTPDQVEEVVGHGIVGVVNGQRYRVGKRSWFDDLGTSCDGELATRANALQAAGHTLIVAADDARVLGVIAASDPLRPTAMAAIQELRRLGVNSLTMLSGDHPAVVARIAEQLGLNGEGGLLPEDKLKRLDALKQQQADLARPVGWTPHPSAASQTDKASARHRATARGQVGMIGDGMNDAPSLAAADVGFSLGGAGTDVALETADVVLMADDLMRLPYAIALARQTQRIVQQNLILAFTVMIVLFITTLVTTLPLPLAVLGHEGSTVLVILNGLRMFAFPKPRSRAVQGG